MIGIAIRFHINFSLATVDGKVQFIIPIVDFDLLLPFGPNPLSLQFGPEPVLQGTFVVQVIDFDCVKKLVGRCRDKDNPSPPATKRLYKN